MHFESASKTHCTQRLAPMQHQYQCSTSPSRPWGHPWALLPCALGQRCCPLSSLLGSAEGGPVGTVFLTSLQYRQGYCPPGIFSSASIPALPSRARLGRINSCCCLLYLAFLASEMWARRTLWFPLEDFLEILA